MSLLLPSINLIVKSSMSLVFAVIKLLARCCIYLLSFCSGKFTFTYRQDFFIFYQFSIWFKLITPTVWYNLPFTRLYFAPNSPNVVTNIFSVSVFIELQKCMPSKLNLVGYFLYFSNMFWVLLFSI